MTKPQKFRKKPVVIESIQYDGQNDDVILDWMDDSGSRIESSAWRLDGDFTIRTLEGDMTASKGDWIIRGVQGEFYPCKPDIFEATYEEVKEDISVEGHAIGAVTANEIRARRGKRAND